MAFHLLSVKLGPGSLAGLEKRVSFSRNPPGIQNKGNGQPNSRREGKAENSLLLWIQNMWVHLNHLSKFIMIKSQIMFAPHLQLDGSTDGEDLQKH